MLIPAGVAGIRGCPMVCGNTRYEQAKITKLQNKEREGIGVEIVRKGRAKTI
jgi:hypothetical protein